MRLGHWKEQPPLGASVMDCKVFRELSQGSILPVLMSHMERIHKHLHLSGPASLDSLHGMHGIRRTRLEQQNEMKR